LERFEPLRVEHAALDVLDPELGRAALRRLDHRRREVADDRAAARPEERSGGEAGDACARREVEHRLPAGRCEPLEHPLGHGRSSHPGAIASHTAWLARLNSVASIARVTLTRDRADFERRHEALPRSGFDRQPA
jgi:hypothetical protein